MANLIDHVEAQLDTDFAMLSASQIYAVNSRSMSFVMSVPGVVSMLCGTKYARVQIRAERWDACPPRLDGWEDIDELPFQELVDDGALELSTFDPGEGGLDIEGVGLGRVQVFARGRHRYEYSSEPDVDAYPPEEWLLRVYPQRGPINPMAGGPRRIAGEGGLHVPTGTPWREAWNGFSSSGWSLALLGSHGFHIANIALSIVRGPVAREELAALMVGRMEPWALGGPDSESAKIPPQGGFISEADPLANASGQSEITTVGDAIDALLEIGLLLTETRDGVQLLIPNPSPQPAWERLGLTSYRLRSAREHALIGKHDHAATDILTAIALYFVQWKRPISMAEINEARGV